MILKIIIIYSLNYLKILVLELLSIGQNYKFNIVGPSLKKINKLNVIYSYCEKKDFQNLKDELGDLLLQIVLHSHINDENKKFSFEEVVDNLCEKLIRRHPYVFDEKRPHTIEDQRRAYFRIKDLEKIK